MELTAFSFSAEVPEGSGCIGSEGGRHVLGNGAKVLFVICGGNDEGHGQSRMDDTGDPAEPPGQTTALLAEIRTSKSSSQRPLRSVPAS